MMTDSDFGNFRYFFLLLLTMLAQHAHAVPLGEQIKNGGFGTVGSPSLTNWTSDKGAANARAVGDRINTLGGNAGFNSFFNDSFAVIGSNVGSDISGNPSSGVSNLFQSFTLPAKIGGAPVVSYSLAISFRSVFDGRDGGSATDRDRFGVYLKGAAGELITVLTQSSEGLPNDCGPLFSCADNQKTTNPFSKTIRVKPGQQYSLLFELSEAATSDSPTETAVGIDSVSITGDVHFVPEPPILAILFPGILIVGRMIREGRKRDG